MCLDSRFLYFWYESTLSLRIDGSGHGNTWNVLDQHLKSLDPKVLISLRKLQESKCSVDSRALGMVSATQSELLEDFKRYPWAHTAHRACTCSR